MTPDAVIKDLGGTGAVSDALGLPASTVSTWRTRGIPPRRWSEIVRLAGEKGCRDITFETLAATAPAAPLAAEVNA